ncbi:hypothetical protein NMG60_11024464 [Bertholletia excelsa]
METVLLRSSTDQSISPCKQIRNPKRNHRSFISRRRENFDPSSNSRGGLLHAPPPSLSSSYPHSVSVFSGRNLQPPLLPLPITKPDQDPRKLHTRTRDKSRTPKKSKPSFSPKRGDSGRDLKPAIEIGSAALMGPDPDDLPKDVSGVISSSLVDYTDFEKFSGSAVFTLSPPPSSLPLPTFFLRPKLSCNAEAATEIDAGATDNLRRLLRIR